MLNLDTLNPEQRDAVETVRGPVLILAGAGTGKTRVITFRIAHMVQRGIAPENILAVTFTNKAAREMLERVNQLLPKRRSSDDEKPSRPTVSTFHSLCVRILRQHIELLGYKKNFVIYDEAEQLGAIKKILANVSAKGEQTDPRAVLTLLSKFKNGGAAAEAAFKDPNVSALAEHVRKKYESALKACNAVDFDDLILLTLRLFNEHPEALDACRARFRYVMVDEYQDTNAAQFQLVHALTLKHRNLCVVGDDDQSIYGWRGAEVANLLDLEKHFPEVKVVKLEQNYPLDEHDSSGRQRGHQEQRPPTREESVVAERAGRENPPARLRHRRHRGTHGGRNYRVQAHDAAGAVGRPGDSLPHESPVSAHRDGAAQGGHSLPPHRRAEFLRPA